MSNLKSVVINGHEYVPVIENGEITSIKRFNKEHGMLVVVNFASSESDIEKELLELLTTEYIQQITSTLDKR